MSKEDRVADGDPPTIGRRQYLKFTSLGTAAATGVLAGCSGGGDGGDGGSDGADGGDGGSDGGDGGDGGEQKQEEEHEEELPEGVSEEEFTSGPVPSVYETATSLGDEQRKPGELVPKADVSFAEYDEAVENSAHQPGTACGNCAEFIPDRNGDGFGACAKVSGYIGTEDWCTLYEALPEPELPEGMSEDDLATSPVPDVYTDAKSQGGERRKAAAELLSHEEVQLTESVDAAKEGLATPGQSCGNCAEFIPDKNGDTWGACAKVEGYIAVEDWCSVYEHITEVL